MIGAEKTTRGFALPTILIASVVMLIVLISAVAAASSIRSGMDSQYYDQLTREAAESGIAKAQGCLQQSAYIAQWTVAKPLQPWTDCSGNPLVSTETCPETAATYIKTACSVLAKNNIRSTFSVSPPTTSTSGVQVLTATSTVQLIRSSNGAVWRTYSDSSSASVGANISISYTSISNSQSDGSIGMPFAAQSFSFGGDGNVYGLGYNNFGILGNGTRTNATQPVKFQLPGTLKAKSVYVNALSGGWDVFVIASDDQAYGAGVNNVGQLGNGSTSTWQQNPVKFNLPVGEKAAKAVVVSDASYVITQSGSVYGAGAGTYGQLGNGAAASSTTPVKMTLPVGEKAVSIEADWHSVYILTQSGKAYMTGINEWGQAGNNTSVQVNTPIRFTNAGDSGQPTAKQVATDGATGWVLKSDGTIYGSGRAMYGALGNSTAPVANGSWSHVPLQFQIGSESGASMATDFGNLVVVTTTGKVFGSGYNSSGELGCGDTAQHNVPCQMALPAGKIAKSVVNTGYGAANYGNNTFIITTTGVVYGAGDNNYGQLGIGASSTPKSSPQLMILPSGITALSVRSGAGTAVVLGSDSRVYAVGNNNYGQLGTGNTSNLATPTATNYLNMQPATFF